ncbi:MAG TPA: cyclic nucleotide-gated ion channel [Rhizomicrobium sp.]|jgi:voltage-gated potassium channel|nr:cyclic nucleotide-gated ion channel [Rhizomicrobium sp.]
MSTQAPALEDHLTTARHRAYVLLEGGQSGGFFGHVIEVVLISLIVGNVLAYTVQSIPTVDTKYALFFNWLEGVSVVIFTLEYLVRIWTAPEDPTSQRGRWWGRFTYALRPMMLIDLLSFAPAYIAFFIPFIDLRFLRLVRLLRLLKIARYSPALSTLMQVLAEERRALYGTVLLLLCAMVFAAAAMHVVEGGDPAASVAFKTMPGSMYWAITTLTTVGYGDVTPISAAGRFIAGLTMIVGLGLFALPVGIVATGFVNSIHRRDFVVTFGMLSRVPLFRGIDAQIIGEMMTMLRARACAGGTVISAAGARADAMYFVISGEVEASLQNRKIRFRSGDFFGELALLEQTMRSATVVAVESSRILTLAVDDFNHLLTKHPGLMRRIHKMAAARAEDIAQAGAISESEIKAARRMRKRAERNPDAGDASAEK